MNIRGLRGLALILVALFGAVGLVVTATMPTLVHLAATALIMGGTGMKALGDPHHWGTGTYVDQVNNTYLADQHLDEGDLHWVSTPEQFWPATSLTDISFDTSVARGVLSLDDAIQTTAGDKVVVGYSQSANIATREKRHLAELRAQGATVPAGDELSFVFVANPNRPNGGILARFEGLYIPILGVTFDGATPDDEYPTIDVAREYDLIADFPEYPLNLLADLNALLGYVYLHPNYGSSVINLSDSGTYQSYTSGNTTYYLVHTEHLPMLKPLRDMGIPAPILDLAEPTLRVLIDLAYDRTPENMGVPTRAGLIPRISVDKLRSDLAAAAKEGVHDALDDLGFDPGGTTAHTAESPAPVDKPATSALQHSRPHLTGRAPAAVNGTRTPETATTSGATPGQRSTTERIRRTLVPEKPFDDITAQASAHSPRPPHRNHRWVENGSAQPKSNTTNTTDGDSADKPRRHHRGHSDAA